MSKSFLKGMSRAINLFPKERKARVSLPPYSNEEALRKDLEQVGSDMYFSIKSIEKIKKINAQNNTKENNSSSSNSTLRDVM